MWYIGLLTYVVVVAGGLYALLRFNHAQAVRYTDHPIWTRINPIVSGALYGLLVWQGFKYFFM